MEGKCVSRHDPIPLAGDRRSVTGGGGRWLRAAIVAWLVITPAFLSGDRAAAGTEPPGASATTDSAMFSQSMSAPPGPAGAVDELPNLAGDPEAIAAGKRIFSIHCYRCHGPEGGGGIGPDFTDNEQLHGEGYLDIVNTITHGVEGRPMKAWRETLGSSQIRQVAAFVFSLKGTRTNKPKKRRFTLMLITP